MKKKLLALVLCLLMALGVLPLGAMADAAPTITAVTPDKTAANVGETITCTAAASGGTAPLQFCFYVYKDGTVVKKGSYGSSKTFSYAPTAAGEYTAKAFVKDAAGRTANLLGGKVAVSAGGAPTVTAVTPDKASAAPGDTVTWTATASGGKAPLQYCFYVYRDGAVVKKGSYGSSNAFSYAVGDPGEYTAKAFVKDAAGRTANLLGGKVTVSAGGALKITSVTVDTEAPSVGDEIRWNVIASGGAEPLQYCFYVYCDGKTVYKGRYEDDDTFSYVIPKAGSYSVKAFVRDAAGVVVSQVGGAFTVGSAAPLKITSVTVDTEVPFVGDEIRWNVTTSGGAEPLLYCFYVYCDGKTVYKGSYEEDDTFSYVVPKAGSYSVKAFVKDAAGVIVSQVGGAFTTADENTLRILSLTSDCYAADVGDEVRWTAEVSGGSGTLQYCFYLYRNGKTYYKDVYQEDEVFSYLMTASGTYTVKVFVRDAAGTIVSLLGGQVVVR